MNTDLYNQLKGIFHQKVQAVQFAEMQQSWSKKTIEKETEFLYLIKQLIENYEDLSLNKDAKIMAYEKFLIDILANLCALYAVNQVYFSMDYTNLITIINTTDNKAIKHLTCSFLEFYLRQEIGIASEKEKQMLLKTYNLIPVHFQKLTR
jgi:hypothetical protein